MPCRKCKERTMDYRAIRIAERLTQLAKEGFAGSIAVHLAPRAREWKVIEEKQYRVTEE